MKYNRSDINDTLRTATIVSNRDNKPRFVYATGCGFLIDKKPPVFSQKHYRIDRGNIELRPT